MIEKGIKARRQNPKSVNMSKTGFVPLRKNPTIMLPCKDIKTDLKNESKIIRPRQNRVETEPDASPTSKDMVDLQFGAFVNFIRTSSK